MLGTAGHVDHGKTALVKMLTGCNTDRLAEEQQRGLTIDLGYAPCRMYDERIVGVVDVPGHVDFIRNMVAGVQGIDVVIFVVAANDGVMPQTREHLDILTLLGVRHGVIALTKVDMVDEEMRELAADDVRQFVRGTFLDGAPICPISNITGEGFDGFFTALNAVVDACEEREISGLFRVWISDTFTIRGFGSVVTGIPASGVVHLGDKLHLFPGDEIGRVRRLEVYGEDAEEGRAGECLAINLTDIDADALHRGTLLCAGDAVQPVTMVEAELRLLDAVTRPLKDYTQVHLHVGTAEAMAYIAVLDDRELHPAQTHFVQLRLSEPLGVAPGDRFVIRSSVAGLGGGHITTIGGGRILGVSNLRLRRNRPWTLAMLQARREAIDSPRDWCALMLKEAGVPLDPRGLAQRAYLPVHSVNEILPGLLADEVIHDAGNGRYLHGETIAAAGETIRQHLEEFYAANPLALGIGEGEFTKTLTLDHDLLRLAIAQLLEVKILERRGVVLALKGRKAAISDDDRRLLTRLEEEYTRAGLTPPALEELPELFRERADRLAKLTRLLVDNGILVRLDQSLLMHRDAVAAARAVAIRLFAEAGAFTTMDFRDALGVSRKYAVPLLDYFDTARLTVRAGNRRTPGVEAKKALMV